MEITLDFPEPLARALGYGSAALPRRLFEALLVDECARGRLSRAKVAELLGIGFHEAEELFTACRVPYPAKDRIDDSLDNDQLTTPA